VRLHPQVLIDSIASVGRIDVEHGFAAALQQVVAAAQRLFGASGAGLMLLEEGEVLRWAAATDQRTQTLEIFQERLGKGPCMRAFRQGRPAVIGDVVTDGQVAEVATELLHAGIHGVLTVPVELEGGPIGTLAVYTEEPRDWDTSEVGGLQAYAGVVATLLSHAVAAHVHERLARQLQRALNARVLIEQAKGVLMAREHIDAQAAFEQLRDLARSARRRLPAVAREVVAAAAQPAPSAARPASDR
jgi:GAF domain-containing protein